MIDRSAKKHCPDTVSSTVAHASCSAATQGTDSAPTAKKWWTFLVHFVGGSDGAYKPLAIEEFIAAIEYAKGLGNVWLDSVVNVGAYWIGQKVLTALTTKSTWTRVHSPSVRERKCCNASHSTQDTIWLGTLGSRWPLPTI
jgi:hypothetical protein